jgi:spermidine/putrescine transport system permease protein
VAGCLAEIQGGAMTQRAQPLAIIHPLWQFGFYLIPVGMLCIVSFWLLHDFQPTPAFNLQNYNEILTNHVYQQAFWSSLKLAIGASLLSVTFALPLAFAITFAVGDRLRKFFIFALLWPFFSNYVTRMFSMQLMLGDQGILNSLLLKSGIIHEPIKMLYSEFAILLGLLSILVPVSAMIMCLALTKLDRTLISASSNLGASGWQTFARISLPFALPGVLGAFMYSFIVAVGDFVCPRILGGNQVYTLSILIEDRMKVNDWPMAAALGVVIMLASLAVMAIVLYCFNLTPTARFAQRGVQRREG